MAEQTMYLGGVLPMPAFPLLGIVPLVKRRGIEPAAGTAVRDRRY